MVKTQDVLMASCLALSTSIGFASAAQNPPKLDFIFQMNLTLDATISTGPGPEGTRVAVPITGGYVVGPKGNGTIMPIGADFGAFDALGNFNVDSHSILHMDDGSYIYAHSVGPVISGPTAMDHIKFETGAKTFSWLNEILAVAVTDFPGPWVSLDVWQVSSDT